MSRKAEPLLFSNEDVEALRERVRSTSWSKTTFSHIRHLADETIDREFNPPQPEPSDPGGTVIRSFDEHRAFALRKREQLTKTIVGLNTALVRALSYAVSGKDKYGSAAADILLAYARSGLFEQTKTPETALGNSVFGMNYMMSVDLLRGAFSPAEQAEVDAFLGRLAQEIVSDSIASIPHFPGGVYSNHFAFHHGTVGVIGAYLDNDRFIRWALESKAGFFDLIDRGVLDRGLWQEGTTGYHFVTLAALTYLAVAFRPRKLRPDLFTARSRRGNTLEMLFEGPIRLAFPDLSLPSIGDTYGYVYNLKGHGAIMAAWRFLKKPVYGWILSQSKPHSICPAIDSKGGVSELVSGLLWSRERPSGIPAPARSELFSEHGYAVLKQVESRKYWGSDSLAAVLTFDRSRQHSHPDKLSIILFGKGKLLAPDLGAKSTERELNFLSLVRKNWNIHTASHNTLVVDMQDQRTISKQLKLLVYEKKEKVGIVSVADFGTLYPGVSQRRTLLMTDDYFLDMFSVGSDEEHTYDWVLRSFDDEGTTRADWPGKSFDLEVREGPYSMMRNVRSTKVDRTWSCHWKQGAVRFWLSMLGEPGTRVIFAEGPQDDRYSPPNIPMVLVRRVAMRTHYVSLLVPRRGQALAHTWEKVRSVKGVLALRIVGPSYEDYVALNLSFRPRARRLTIVHRQREYTCHGIFLHKRFKHR